MEGQFLNMHLYENVNLAVTEAFYNWQDDLVTTTISTRDGFDRQCNEAMRVAKARELNPKTVAEAVADKLRSNPLFAEVVVSGPGFLNLKISDTAILAHAEPSSLTTDKSQSIVIDFGGPNIAKALHVGHLRSLVIGESLRRILIARGHNVVSDIHFGDWGLPIGMLISEILRRYPGCPVGDGSRIILPLPDNFGAVLEIMYPEVVEACKTYPDRLEEARHYTTKLQTGDEWTWIWKIIRRASLDNILPQIIRLGAHFDLWYGESDARYHIENTAHLLADVLINEDGALVCPVALPSDNKPMPPLIFKKSDGGFTYAATDLATIYQRAGIKSLLYVVDARQSLHFEQVFRAASQFHPGKLTHVKFGTVNGSDGKPFKTRDGSVPTLQWMLDAAVAKAAERTSDPKDAEIIGIGAVKFADLITHRESGYVFDLDKIMAVEGKTGPYVQYAYVRITKILEQAEVLTAPIVITHPSERELLVTCANFAEAIVMAETHLVPTFLAEYAFRLAQRFSQFYTMCPVIGSSEQDSRLRICSITQAILKECLYLLGIDVPGRM